MKSLPSAFLPSFSARTQISGPTTIKALQEHAGTQAYIESFAEAKFSPSLQPYHRSLFQQRS